MGTLKISGKPDWRSAYGFTVPHLPGCDSAGDTFHHALAKARQVIELHLEGVAKDAMEIPCPTEIDVHLENPSYVGGIRVLFEVDVTPLLGNSKKINVTLPR